MYHCLVGFISRNNTYDNKGTWGCVKKMELYSPKIFISWCVKESKWSATLLILNRLWQISIDTIKPKSSIKIIVISRGSAEAITWFLQNVKLRLTLIILFYNISDMIYFNVLIFKLIHWTSGILKWLSQVSPGAKM